MQNKNIGFIGAGQMAQALARGFVAQGLVEAGRVHFADISASAADAFAALIPQAHAEATNRDVLKQADIVFLAVKPQNVADVLGTLGTVGDDKLMVSICAGVTLAELAAGLGSQRIIRVMPNTPCLIGQGASAFACGTGASDDDARAVEKLLDSVGLAVRTSEPLLDAVTGLSGSGPAFVYQFIEALADGGVRMGLARDVAQRLAAQTVLGAAGMVVASDAHPAQLKDRVASPGGTTIAGLAALELGGMRGIVISAVTAAAQRSQELGQN